MNANDEKLTMDDQPMLIVGGGIGGITAAIALAQKQIPVITRARMLQSSCSAGLGGQNEQNPRNDSGTPGTTFCGTALNG